MDVRAPVGPSRGRSIQYRRGRGTGLRGRRKRESGVANVRRRARGIRRDRRRARLGHCSQSFLLTISTGASFLFHGGPSRELLLKEKRITPEQLQEALNYQRQNGGKLGFTFVKLGYVKDDEITALL